MKGIWGLWARGKGGESWLSTRKEPLMEAEYLPSLSRKNRGPAAALQNAKKRDKYPDSSPVSFSSSTTALIGQTVRKSDDKPAQKIQPTWQLLRGIIKLEPKALSPRAVLCPPHHSSLLRSILVSRSYDPDTELLFC